MSDDVTKHVDDFRGDNAALIASIDALLHLDDAKALIPHGLGGPSSHAYRLLCAAKHRLSTPSPDSGERMREALEPFAGVAVGEVWKHFSAENPTLRISSSDGSRHLTFVSAEWFERARAALQESAR